MSISSMLTQLVLCYLVLYKYIKIINKTWVYHSHVILQQCKEMKLPESATHHCVSKLHSQTDTVCVETKKQVSDLRKSFSVLI